MGLGFIGGYLLAWLLLPRQFVPKFGGPNWDPFLGVVTIAIFGTLAVVAAGFGKSQKHFLPLFCVVAAIALIRMLPGIVARLELRDSAAMAVSHAAFEGVWKAPERFLHTAVAATSVALPLLLGVVGSRVRRKSAIESPPEVAEPAEEAESVSWSVWAAAAVAIVLATAYLAPDIGRAVAAAPNRDYHAGWDLANSGYWDFLVVRGVLPIKEFWYPYGLQYLFALIPRGIFLRALSELLLWAYIVIGSALVVARYSPRKWILARFLVLILGMWIANAVTGPSRLECAETFMVSTCLRSDRYLAGLGILLLYAGTVGSRASAERWVARIVLGLATFHALLMEPVQLLYAAPALALVAAGHLWARGFNWLTLRSLLVEGSIFVAAVLAAVVTLALRGQLGGTLDFYRNLGGIVSYASYPSDIREWLRLPRVLSAWVYWAVVLTLILGTSGVASARKEQKPRYLLVVAVGIIGFMLMGKEVTRQGGAAWLWVAPVFGLLLWVALSESFELRRHRAVAGLLVGVLLAQAVHQGSLDDSGRRVLGGPARALTATVQFLRPSEAALNANQSRVAPELFEAFAGYRHVADYIHRKSVGRSPRVWSLGDDPLLHVFIGRPDPYYYKTKYDNSSIHSQHRTVAELSRMPPDFVVWEPLQGAIDNSPPYQLRAPLVFRWAARNLVPIEKVGAYELLRVRRPDEPVPIEWWRGRLGGELDVGQLMTISQLPKTTCRAGSSCSDFLRVTFGRHERLPNRGRVEIEAGGSTFFLTFATEPGVRTYQLNLSRLWFWYAAAASNRRIVGVRSGGQFEVVRMLDDPNTLY